MRKTGRYAFSGTTEHFIPEPLPPHDPILVMDAVTIDLYGQAVRELAKLNEIATHLPNIQRFLKAYVIKEALLSSAIEGIHTTMLDIFTQPLLETKPQKATQLVLNYGQALEAAVAMIKDEGMPIVSRVILKAHKLLMEAGEGDKADPGHYRKLSVKVGNLVPPPAQHVPDLMAELERFINTDESLLPIVKAGLAHVQFETIHPFLDGNGRIGRLLIVLMLIESGVLSEPILYPSYYFKKHHSDYYHYLDGVRTKGDFEAWNRFYLTAIRESAIDAYRRAKEVEALHDELAHIISSEKRAQKAQQLRLNALAVIFGSPVVSVNFLASQLGVSYNTAAQIITDFSTQGILAAQTKQKRGKTFQFKQYIDILEREYA